VEGCGWCAFQGGGACVSDPDFCGVSQFSFTWNPDGCASLGGATAADGGTASGGATATDAGPSPDGAASTQGAKGKDAAPPLPQDAASGPSADH
jgi:hypothetical protein